MPEWMRLIRGAHAALVARRSARGGEVPRWVADQHTARLVLLTCPECGEPRPCPAVLRRLRSTVRVRIALRDWPSRACRGAALVGADMLFEALEDAPDHPEEEVAPS